MQTIISQYKRIDSQWYVGLVEDVIASACRSSRETTPQEIADKIVEEMKGEGEDAYIIEVDRKAIKEFLLRPSDVLEIRYFDYDIDDEVAIVRIGADGKNNIHIANAPQIKTNNNSIKIISNGVIK